MIDRVTIAVGSMEAMVTFYAAALGIELTPREMFERTLFMGRFGDVELLLCPRDLAGVDAAVNTIQLRFLVGDVAAAFARGVDAGGVPLNAPTLLEGAMHAALRDPDGNSLELRERAPA